MTSIRRLFLKSAIIIFPAWSFSAFAVPIVNFAFEGTVTETNTGGGSFPPTIDPTIAAMVAALQGHTISGQVEYLRNAPSVLTPMGARVFSTDVNVTFQSNVLNSPSFSTTIIGEATEGGTVSVYDDCAHCPVVMDKITIEANGSPLNPFQIIGHPLIPGGVSDVYITSLGIFLDQYEGLDHSLPYTGFPIETPGPEDLIPISQFDIASHMLVQVKSNSTGGEGGFFVALNKIYTVPEPGSLPLLSLSLAMLYIRRLYTRR